MQRPAAARSAEVFYRPYLGPAEVCARGVSRAFMRAAHPRRKGLLGLTSPCDPIASASGGHLGIFWSLHAGSSGTGEKNDISAAAVAKCGHPALRSKLPPSGWCIFSLHPESLEIRQPTIDSALVAGCDR